PPARDCPSPISNRVYVTYRTTVKVSLDRNRARRKGERTWPNGRRPHGAPHVGRPPPRGARDALARPGRKRRPSGNQRARKRRPPERRWHPRERPPSRRRRRLPERPSSEK